MHSSLRQCFWLESVPLLHGKRIFFAWNSFSLKSNKCFQNLIYLTFLSNGLCTLRISLCLTSTAAVRPDFKLFLSLSRFSSSHRTCHRILVLLSHPTCVVVFASISYEITEHRSSGIYTFFVLFIVFVANDGYKINVHRTYLACCDHYSNVSIHLGGKTIYFGNKINNGVLTKKRFVQPTSPTFIYVASGDNHCVICIRIKMISK